MNDELRALEAALASLRPAKTADRDALMYRAGEAAGRRSTRWWRTAAVAACVAALAAATAAAVGGRASQPGAVERIVYVEVEPDAPARRRGSGRAAEGRPVRAGASSRGPGAVDELSEFAYFRVRREVLRRGLDALPTPRRPMPDAADARELMRELTARRGPNG
jgi:hypothetical protein